jgi:hypothetical protein
LDSASADSETPRRLLHAEYVLRRTGCSQEDDQLLREGHEWPHLRRRFFSRDTLRSGSMDENTTAAVDGGDGSDGLRRLDLRSLATPCRSPEGASCRMRLNGWLCDFRRKVPGGCNGVYARGGLDAAGERRRVSRRFPSLAPNSRKLPFNGRPYGISIGRLIGSNYHDAVCPRALAGINRSAPTLADRCFTIFMKRKRK